MLLTAVKALKLLLLWLLLVGAAGLLLESLKPSKFAQLLLLLLERVLLLPVDGFEEVLLLATAEINNTAVNYLFIIYFSTHNE